MTQVTLYGKPGCCLCDDARAEIAALRAEREFELTEVDITLDAALWRSHGERIPVVEVDGEEVLELHVNRSELERVLDTVRP